MSGPRASGAARLWDRVRRRRARFTEAVPVRRDRRDLRRRFRRAARAAAAERKTEMTALLLRLAADRVPLRAVLPGRRDSERIIEFQDGTRLLLAARYGRAGLKRLAPGAISSPVWLAQVQPGFTRHWFRLWFASAARPKLVEMMATVAAPAPLSRQSPACVTSVVPLRPRRRQASGRAGRAALARALTGVVSAEQHRARRVR